MNFRALFDILLFYGFWVLYYNVFLGIVMLLSYNVLLANILCATFHLRPCFSILMLFYLVDRLHGYTLYLGIIFSYKKTNVCLIVCFFFVKSDGLLEVDH
jgi:hypothetical protein